MFAWGRYGRAYGEFCKSGRKIGGFRTLRSLVSRGVALCDIPTCFITCPKSFCVAGAILSRRCQKMSCIFRGRRSTSETSSVTWRGHLAWPLGVATWRGRHSTSDVSCCVFFANRIVRAASSGDNVQIPWPAWHFVRCDENWWKPRTKHRFWDSKISGSWEDS